MLCADVSMTQLACFVHRQLDNLFGTWSVRDVGRLFLSSADQRLHFVLDFLQTQTQSNQCLGGNAVSLTNQSEQNMFCTNVVMSQPYSFFLRQRQHFLCAFRKSSKHHISCTSTDNKYL